MFLKFVKKTAVPPNSYKFYYRAIRIFTDCEYVFPAIWFFNTLNINKIVFGNVVKKCCKKCC